MLVVVITEELVFALEHPGNWTIPTSVWRAVSLVQDQTHISIDDLTLIECYLKHGYESLLKNDLKK